MFVGATVPGTGLKTALYLALVGAWVVVVAFAYLTFHMRKSYFRMWAVSWLYYSMYVASSIELQQQPTVTLLATVGQACIGISALCMLWGSLQLIGKVRRNGELGLAALLILVCCFVAPAVLPNQIWVERSVFCLL